MSNPIMQAIVGEISWAQADQLYHVRLNYARMDVDYAEDDDDDDDDRDAHDFGECRRCENKAIDECEFCDAPLCGDHRHFVESYGTYFCSMCNEVDDAE